MMLILSGGIPRPMGDFPKSLRQAILVRKDNFSREIERYIYIYIYIYTYIKLFSVASCRLCKTFLYPFLGHG